MEEYLERLLSTLYIIRHVMDKDINELIDNSESVLTSRHLRKLSLLTNSMSDDED